MPLRIGLAGCQACPGVRRRAPAGASIQDYFLADKVPSAVQPPGRLPVSGASAAAAGGIMQGTITVRRRSGGSLPSHCWLRMAGRGAGTPMCRARTQPSRLPHSL